MVIMCAQPQMETDPSGPGGLAALAITADVEARVSLRAVFDARCWDLRLAQSAPEARWMLAGPPPAVVIVDDSIPGIAWRTLLDDFATGPHQPAPRLVVVSPAVNDRLWAEVLNRGGFDVLEKPLDRVHIAWVVELAFEGWLREGGRKPLARARAAGAR